MPEVGALYTHDAVLEEMRRYRYNCHGHMARGCPSIQIHICLTSKAPGPLPSAACLASLREQGTEGLRGGGRQEGKGVEPLSNRAQS